MIKPAALFLKANARQVSLRPGRGAAPSKMPTAEPALCVPRAAGRAHSQERVLPQATRSCHTWLQPARSCWGSSHPRTGRTSRMAPSPALLRTWQGRGSFLPPEVRQKERASPKQWLGGCLGSFVAQTTKLRASPTCANRMV